MQIYCKQQAFLTLFFFFHFFFPFAVAIFCPTSFPPNPAWTSTASASRPTTPCSACSRWALFLQGFGSASLPGCSSASRRWTCRYWDQQILINSCTLQHLCKHFIWIAWNVVLMQSFEPKRNTRSQCNRNSVIYSFAGTQQRNRCSTFRVRRSQTIYWKEGLLVTFDGGYLRSELGLQGLNETNVWVKKRKSVELQSHSVRSQFWIRISRLWRQTAASIQSTSHWFTESGEVNEFHSSARTLQGISDLLLEQLLTHEHMLLCVLMF